MRPWSLVLLLSAASPVLAQEAAPPPAAAPAEKPPAAQKPAAAPPAARPPAAAALTPAPVESEEEDTRGVLREDARFVLNALLAGDVRSATSQLTFPFQLEDKRFDAAEPLIAAWVKQLRNKRTDLMTLYDIEVLPYADFEKKYGKPPARLGLQVPRGEVFAALANLSGHAAVLLFRPTVEGWRVFAYTD
jgi:hypothetical protein